MAVAPSVQNSTQTDYSGDAVKSPTTLVMEYLAKNKMSPNMPGYGAAVRKALADNAADPSLIPGLRNDQPATEADDQAAMRGRGGPGVGQSGSAASKVETPSNPTQRGNPPMADLSRGPTNEADYQPNTTKVSSAAPVSDTGQPVQRVGPDDFASFATPAAIAGAAIGAGAIPGMMGNRPEFVGNAQPASGRVTDVNPTAIVGPQPDAALPPPTTMEAAMQEAIRMPNSIGLAGTQPGTETAPDYVGGIRPPVADPGGLGRQPLPAGINPYEVGGSASPAPSTTVLPENTRGAPVVPLGSATPRDVPMRKMVTPSYYKNMPTQADELFNLGRRIVR